MLPDEQARERLKREIGLTLDLLQNDLDWITGRNLGSATEISIWIRYKTDTGAEITVSREISTLFDQ